MTYRSMRELADALEGGFITIADRKAWANDLRAHANRMKQENSLASEVTELREALEYVANLRSAYWVRPMNDHGWRLIETDCGAMIVCGEGSTPLEAIRNARSSK